MQLFVYAAISAALMISYEFCTGLICKLLGLEVPWVYKKYADHKFRSISAFSLAYFLAWYGLGLLSFYIFEIILK